MGIIFEHAIVDMMNLLLVTRILNTLQCEARMGIETLSKLFDGKNNYRNVSLHSSIFEAAARTCRNRLGFTELHYCRFHSSCLKLLSR